MLAHPHLHTLASLVRLHFSFVQGEHTGGQSEAIDLTKDVAGWFPCGCPLRPSRVSMNEAPMEAQLDVSRLQPWDIEWHNWG